MEKIEKLLLHFGLVTEQQLLTQQVELLDDQATAEFKLMLAAKLNPGQESSSLLDGHQINFEDASADSAFFLERVQKMLGDFANDDMWYELYKSVTSEKDMAEKDQQRLVRRERRKIKKKKKLREQRQRLIHDSLKIRENKRRKDG